MRITVVGLGKIGLPLAVQYAKKGHKVTGADISQATVDLVNAGQEPFPGEHLLQEYLSEVVGQGRLSAMTDTRAAVAQSDAVVVAVPLFVDDEANPDFCAMDAAATAIGQGLEPGTLVSFETTLPVGITRTRLAPILEQESGLKVGEDFFVAFSPERVFTGRVFADLRRYPKLVGGIDDASTERAIAFYEAVLDFDERPDLEQPNGVWDLGSPEAAELAKLAETTYRDVNIGLANQLALFSEKMGIDFHRVVEACNSQPFSHLHRPGVSVGGHCIPVYPRLYLWNDPTATIVAVAREVNAQMPFRVVSRLHSLLDGQTNMRVAILGATYRGGVKETAYSGVFDLVAALEAAGSAPMVHDPLLTAGELVDLGFVPFHRGSSADAVILHSNHAEYLSWGWVDVPGVRLVLDGRHFLNQAAWLPARLVAVGT